MTRLDTAAAASVNRTSSPGWFDTALRRLSRSADHGVLWALIATVLISTGRRRAGVRGMASLGIASLVANQLGKRFFGGDRPLLDAVPLTRRIRNQPGSPSFPSGHAASAAAFVAGVGLESAGAGAAAAPLAAGVAYSRVHVGAHWLSDVLGGVGLGLAAALVGALVVPARPHVVCAASAPSIELPVLETGEGLFVFVNPSSGRDARRPDPTAAILESLPRTRVHRLAPGDDVGLIVRDTRGVRAIGAYGGDGTVGVAASVARSEDLPLLVLPGGTFNHFSRAVGVTSVTDGIDALRRGTGKCVDVAELSFESRAPIIVLNTASTGIYPNFVTERERYEKRLGKPLAALIAGVRVLRGAEPIELTIDGRQAAVWSVFVGVNRYAGGAAPMTRGRLDDGVLDVRILHARGAARRARGITALVFGRRAAATVDALPWWTGHAVVESFESPTLDVRIRTRGGVDPGFAHDGEASMSTPGGALADGEYGSTMRIAAQRLRVYAPTSEAPNHRSREE